MAGSFAAAGKARLFVEARSGDQMTEEEISRRLRKMLSPKLYNHCAGVAETAGRLAESLGTDVEKARLAGWLHDAAREWPGERLLQFAQDNNLNVDKYSREEPTLLHGPAGALLARRQWGVTDREVLDAIENHTFGRPGMSLLAQIIYLADKTEPDRSYPQVEALRDCAAVDFRKALRMAAANTISYLLQKENIIHPLSLDYWNWLVQNRQKGV